MIYTLTLNPAVDLELISEQLPVPLAALVKSYLLFARLR